VTITDANGCTLQETVVVDEPDQLVATISGNTNIDCNGASTGDATVSVGGGVANYTYSWNTTPAQTGATATGLAAGSYTVTVTDANNNTTTATVTLTEPTALVATVTSVDDVTCTGNTDGTVNVTVSGGTTNYTYSWDSGETTEDLSSVAEGTYELTVTDANGCTTQVSATVGMTDNVAPIASAKDITVYVDASGNVSITAADVNDGSSDACGIDTYAIDKEDFTCADLGANTVTLTVTDVNGNSATATATVTVVDAIDPTITAPAAITVNADAGSCDAAASGVALGTPVTADNCSVASVVNDAPTTYALGANTVTWTVTDGSGNTATATQIVTVVDSEDPVITAPADITVAADAGSCDAVASGVTLGSATTSDNCSVASTTNNAPATFTIGANTVTWTVTDAAGNTATATQTVTVVDTQDPVVSCPADVTAYADATTDGTSVSWSTATATDNCTVDTIYSSIAQNTTFTLGTTTVEYYAIDAAGNTDTCAFEVTVLDTVSPVITNCPGTITQDNDLDSCGAYVSWSSPTYFDNSGNYTVSSTHDSGDYFPVGTTTVTITVTDAAGNSTECVFDVVVEDNQAPTVVPVSSLTITLDGDGMYTMTAAQLDSASYDNCAIDTMYLSNDFANCNAMPMMTTYLVIVDIYGNKDSALVDVNVLPSVTQVLSTTSTIKDAICYGSASGEIALTTTGGVAPYNYNWSDGQITSTATGLAKGSYWYTVADTNGCAMSDTVAINEPDSLYVTAVASIYGGGYNVSQFGASDGALTTTVVGGTAPYTYNWNAGAYTSPDLNAVPAGAYTLVVEDSLGCTYTYTDTLTEPDQLLVNAESISIVVCPDDPSGEAIAKVVGGVAPYSFLWDNGDTIDFASGLVMGIFEVTVTDANGAVATDTVFIDASDYDCDGITNLDEGGTPGGGGGEDDLDGDGIPNWEDEDSDGDGLTDEEEFDYNKDGEGFDDCDGDGIPNFLDPDFCGLLIPDVFTPNGDGDNDTWEILGITAYPDNNVMVYNRWGELVYAKDNYQNEFNGRANSRTYMNKGDGLLPTGTYYYMVKLYATGDVYTGYVYITK
jgi:gliding motility-associated-like protein